jgi:hypothetical protein
MNTAMCMTQRESNFETASWILGLAGDNKNKVKTYILEHGMKSFLLHHEELELTDFDHEKVEVLKRVMQKYDGDIAAINFGDMDNLD